MEKRIRVLLIEDDPDQTHLINLYMNEACGPLLMYVMECADSLRGGLEILAKKDFDVVLLDLMLPDSQGLETLFRVRDQARGASIIVLTNFDEEETGLAAIAHGAQDFLIKIKMDALCLRRAVSYALERHRLFRQMETVVENSPDGMVVVDAAGDVRCLNSAARALFGTKAEQMLGKPFGFSVRSEQGQELRLPGLGDQERTAEMRVTQVEWRGHPAWLASIRDITELKKLEQIRADIKQQRHMDQLKENLVHTVSHDLRSPLSVIKAAVGNLKDRFAGPLTPKQSQLLETLDRHLDRLTRQLNNFLDLSRLESGRIEVKRQRVEIQELMETAVAGFKPLLKERGLALEAEIAPELPPADADPDMVAQVLGNLLDNALRHARAEIKLRAAVNRSGELCISVCDDGPGFAPDKIPSLFDKFVQFDRPSAGESRKSVALGLAICHEALRANGGRIWAENGPAGGALFHFTLPPRAAAEGARGQDISNDDKEM